uniref:Uncharacterized protein n=1 Tax=Capra hircus TaxID=9925 RepID=A0A8C2RD07_CAPHI
MSLHIFSDGNVTGDKSTENCDFLFSPPELTGRSSVLRLSQKENVPPKSTARAVKVSRPGTCFPGNLLKLEASCFALGDPIGLGNCHQIYTQKEKVPTAARPVSHPCPALGQLCPFMWPSELCAWEASRPGAPARACSPCGPCPWAPPSRVDTFSAWRNGSGCLLGVR